MLAAGWGCQFDIALQLLEAGADHSIYLPNFNKQLVHIVLEDEQRRKADWSHKQEKDHERLVQWLKDHGVSFEKAREDIARWNEWKKLSPKQFTALRKREVEERIRREDEEKFPQEADSNEPDTDPGPSWYERVQWNAEDVFDNPKVVALCKAIEQRDLAEIDRLVADGADVNAVGRGKMTPLLWAFPDKTPDVFKRILEHGADPNVRLDYKNGSGLSGTKDGSAVVHLAAENSSPVYLRYVMHHGGDLNLPDSRFGKTPLVFLIEQSTMRDKTEHVQILIDGEISKFLGPEGVAIDKPLGRDSF
jgi:hypothetical protein